MTIPPIISVDDHMVEPPDLWQRWLPKQFRDRGPRVVRMPWAFDASSARPFVVKPAPSGPNTDFWVVEGIADAMGVQTVAAGFAAKEIDGTPRSYAEMRPGCYSVKARLEDMDVINVERSLCFPQISRFCGQLFLALEDKALAAACVAAYNDFIVDEWAGESGGRLLPVGIIPLWDPARAAMEVRRNAARGARAVAFSELPTRLGLPSIHDPSGYWMPFLEACDETSTVICIHIGSSSTLAATSEDAPKASGLTCTSFNSQLSLADWLFSGHLQRFPGLKLAFSESQIGWMPYVYERADRIWRTGYKWTQIPADMTEPPSSYAQGRVFGCFFEDTFGVESRNAIGIDQICVESDYPHQDTTWPHTHKYVEEAMAGIPDEDVYKMVRGNAIRMLDLPEVIGTDRRPAHVSSG
jgi:predicted TIM-barrel fold metal-dependent hydrolase